MRELSTVIESILETIPPTEEDLRHDLESLRISAMYAAPEMSNELWARGATILADWLGDIPPDIYTEWTHVVLRKWQGKDNK